MTVIICPGVHSSELTESFLRGAGRQITDYLVFPSETSPPYSAPHIVDFLTRQFAIPRQQASHSAGLPRVPLLFISFSAGVVGAIGAAWIWQSLGRTVKGFIALDGWGVPLYGNFPIYRMSHDRFTHHSSAVLGRGRESFYADPPVSHLDLWRSPQIIPGWHVVEAGDRDVSHRPTTAIEFLTTLLAQHGEI
jgi:hypothetical protein